MVNETNTPHARRQRKVLVVEDNDINRSTLCAMLESEYDVIEARDGIEGLEELAAHYRDLALVLLDVYMPRCDGFEFLRRMRADNRYDSVPVVVATASGLPDDEVSCLELGANDFVLKPYNFRVIANRINNLVHLRESAALVNQLTYDSVTGLYSKVFFYRAAEDALAAGAFSEGAPASGASSGSAATSGAFSEVAPATGASPEGAPAAGASLEGAPAAGASQENSLAAGTPSGGATASGAVPEGEPAAGASLEGEPAAGTPSGGAAASGAFSERAPAAGTSPEGAPAAGASLENSPASGASPKGAPAAGTFQDYDLICSDVESFRLLNDRYGEEKCDELLRSLAERISSLLPGLVAGGRIDTDVCAFLVPHREGGWEDVLGSVGDSLPLPHVSVKFGVVQHVDPAATVQVSCSRARSALETVKGLHGANVALFSDEIHKRQLLEQTIRESMAAALSELQFSVFYQPKHDVRTNSIGGAEALVRWFHPEIGLISPGLFIPIFEKNGFITELDLFVWEEACKEIRRCINEGLPIVPLSVNASRLDFDVSDLPRRFADIADKHGVDHSLLHVELTETAYSDNPNAVLEILREMKALGFSTELDDFGAGYSSLVSLNTLPLDVMKLDMSMIRQATALGDFRIVESTINLARVLGLKTVVEGVETEEEAKRVIDMGCDFIQGYYYAKPLSREEFEQYLAEGREK